MSTGYVESMGLEKFVSDQELTQGEIYPAKYEGSTSDNPTVMFYGLDEKSYFAAVVPSRSKKTNQRNREDTARFTLQEMREQFGTFKIRLISDPKYQNLKVVIYS
ncbi:MAG: hypothetical protein O2779_05205 [Nanoarchaeota archaeon]|nr:hypothetical protein [Nanoarchaeota archaeon]